MLRITVLANSQSTTLKLAGALTGESVKQLEHCWHQTTASASRRRLFVDLSDATGADAEGEALLQAMARGGAITKMNIPGIGIGDRSWA